MKPALVTGGCGFVGRHVVRRLLGLGHVIWIVDDLSTGQQPDHWLDGSVLRSQKVIFNKDDIRDFLRRTDLPAFGDVFHFAAVVGGRLKIEGDPISVAQDLAIDADFFRWAVKARPERILYASSSAAYPIDLQSAERSIALPESLIDFNKGNLGCPDMTYGWSKLTGEYLAKISVRYGLKIACIRPFSGYGGDQDGTYPVPAIAERAVRHEDPLIIWGSGEQGRDFVHIDDCVDAMLIALNKISDGSAINIGSGQLMTFKQVAQKFAEIANYKPTIKALEDKPQGVYARYADTKKATELLGWRPKTSMEEGFKKVYKAIKERLQNDLHKT